MFLRICNPGEAPVEGYTLLGVSTTRNCGIAGTIGQFGSGAKHAINVILRAGLKVIIYCGPTKLEFLTCDDEINDGLTTKAVKRVFCRMGGTSTRTIDLGWVLDFGAIDWTDLGMALREFISNAIDRTIRQTGDFIPAMRDGDLSVTMVEDEKLRAKTGYTQAFIQINPDVEQYQRELSRRFLHFSERPEQVKQSLLPKANRNLNGSKAAMIYREGVFVREFNVTDAKSVYDYNFRADELRIDESRNSSEYDVKAACAKLMRKAAATELVPVFRSLVEKEEIFEAGLDPYYICPSWETPGDEQQQNWKQAWQTVAGDAVLCGPSETVIEFVEHKGVVAKSIKVAALVEVARRFGILTGDQVLTDNERKGREVLPASDTAIQAVHTVWNWLEKLQLINGATIPPVGCFRDVVNSGQRLLGYCDGKGVYLADDHASGGVNKLLLKTALEVCVHWITGATDGSRDVQDFLLRTVIEIVTENCLLN
jgi:hypothetical protein